jgi:phage tail-like protein
MSNPVRRSYLFATPAQWDTCLFDRIDREAFEAKGNLGPIAPYEQTAELHESSGAHAPAVTRAGEIFWRDDAGCVHRLTACSDEPDVGPAPYAIAHASRIVATNSGWWVAGESRNTLELYDEESFSRLAVVELPDAHILDIAGDGHESVFVLVECGGVVQALHIDCSGRVVATVAFEGVDHATAFVFLRRSKRFVVCSDSCPRLSWFPAEGGAALKAIVIGALHPCFHATALGTDGRGRVFLVGNDGADFGAKPYVLIFDADGERLGEIALDPRDSPATGVSGMRDSLLVSGARGLLRYRIASVVPDGTSEVRCSVITPMLHSPDREDARRWLRIDASAHLPEGSALEISYASTADGKQREPGAWSAPISFHGARSGPASFSAPLFDVHDPYVWVRITMSATAGGSLPSLDELAVLYPGQSLMQNLPAIYRRAEAQPGNFLRALVGVLESTTQGIDARIASLASQVHPDFAAGPWLDFVARWLGLPWDDALSDEQKKRVIAAAPELARDRGTRAGLETLLQCLLPGTARFRVIDTTADFGFAMVGGGACRGSALPVMLGGFTASSTALDETSVLGHMRLPCPGSVDDGVRDLAGAIRIDIAASRVERRAWEPWLPALVNAMVPLTARPQLRWVSSQALRSARLDGSLVLQGVPTAHLGSDAVTGVARLPERGSRITSTGADIGTRLQ